MALIRLNNQSLTAVSALPAGVGGKVLQVVQDIETAASSETLAAGVFSSAILSATITPSSASNKILVLCTLHLTTGNQTGGAAALLKRGGTEICIGDANGNMARASGGGLGAAIGSRLISNIQMTFLDSPSTTNATAYTAHGKHGFNSSQALYWNRELDTTNASNISRVPSTITLMEIAG